MARETILSDLSVSMTEFKKNPNETLRESGGRTVAVLSHNKPAFYMVPAERYEAMLEELTRASGQGTPQAKGPRHRGDAG